MKNRLLSIILVTILLITMVPDVFAAITVTTSPYSGDYLLAINTSTDAITTQYSGNMYVDTTGASSPQFSMDVTNTVSSKSNVVNVTEENGLKMEQIDPNDMLASMRKPNSTTVNQSKILNYSDVYATQYSVGDQRTFTTKDVRYSPPQNVNKTFTLKYSGTKCNIWLESDNTVNLTDSNISSLGSEFDNNIYTNISSNFGTGYDKDADGKTAIILYDIQDGWNGTTVTGFTGGFFSPNDLIGNDNNMDVLHIDTYPAMGTNKTYPSITTPKTIISHEYQHLINFSYSYTHGLAEMPIWLN